MTFPCPPAGAGPAVGNYRKRQEGQTVSHHHVKCVSGPRLEELGSSALFPWDASLPVAKGIATSNKDVTFGAPGLTTRSY